MSRAIDETIALALLRANGQGGTAEACLALLDRQSGGERCVAVVRPGSWLDRSLQAALPPERLFRLAIEDGAPPDDLPSAPLTARPPHAGAPDLIVADRDRDVPAAPRIGWPGRLPRPPQRLRRLDTLCAGDRRIGLLAIEGGDVAATLRGAAGLLGGGGLSLVVDLATAPSAERVGLWEVVVAAAGPGFAWHDGFLLPRADPADRSRAVLLHAGTTACGLPAGTRILPEAPASIAALLPPDEHRAAGLAWRGWDGPLGRLSPPAPVAIDFDAALPCAGFYPAETDGAGVWWRWSGPDAHAAFALPVGAPGRYRLRLDVLAWGAVPNAAALAVAIDGETLRLEFADAQSIRFAPVAIVPGPEGTRTRVDMVTPPPRRAAPDDPRRIGINLARATLSPAAPRPA